jgi:hypothetical protein
VGLKGADLGRDIERTLWWKKLNAASLIYPRVTCLLLEWLLKSPAVVIEAPGT